MGWLPLLVVTDERVNVLVVRWFREQESSIRGGFIQRRKETAFWWCLASVICCVSSWKRLDGLGRNPVRGCSKVGQDKHGDCLSHSVHFKTTFQTLQIMKLPPAGSNSHDVLGKGSRLYENSQLYQAATKVALEVVKLLILCLIGGNIHQAVKAIGFWCKKKKIHKNVMFLDLLWCFGVYYDVENSLTGWKRHFSSHCDLQPTAYAPA